MYSQWWLVVEMRAGCCLEEECSCWKESFPQLR
jgi:hypothetical protein